MDKQSLSKQAYQLIKADIVSCSLSPGQLIGQAALAQSYPVGITPIREALRQLAQEGFVQSIPRLGYIVSLITVQDVEEIYEMRMLLESAAVRLAAERGSHEQLKSLAESAGFSYTYKNPTSYTEFLQHNADFHHALALASENQRLADLVQKTLDELNRVFHLGLDYRDSAEEMSLDHIALARAVFERDADTAEKLVRGEITRSRERVMQALKRLPNIPHSNTVFTSFTR
jgi:DNA-binding GntR family transcriptional regulator